MLCASCEKRVQSRLSYAIRKVIGQRIHEMHANYCGPAQRQRTGKKVGCRNPIGAPARIHSVGGSVVNAPGKGWAVAGISRSDQSSICTQ
jgi:hypothetical protein